MNILFMIKLLPVEADPIPKKRCYNKNSIKALGCDGSKVIFIMFREVVAFNMRLTVIYA